jgi:8-oxo-dGTP diphosphatase
MIKKLSNDPLERMMAWYHDNDTDPPHEEYSRLVELYLKDQHRVRVGVAVLVRKGSAVLVGRRRDEKGKSRGHGTWALPGGHLEYKEEVGDCARREVLEETGLEISDVRQGPYVNNVFGEDGRHYITLFATAELKDFNAEPRVMEPDKCFEWRWCQRKDVPLPMFPPLNNYLIHHATADKWQNW